MCFCFVLILKFKLIIFKKNMESKFNSKTLLEKHGWKSGSGLGKNEQGMSEPIKASMKKDTAGVGHDAGEKFTFHWWDHVFNTAANNIRVKKGKDGIKLESSGKLEVSTKKSKLSSKIDKKFLYGSFIKSATLTDGVMESNMNSDGSSDSDESDIGTASKCTDDELFKRCGGLTAHKGARHGLNLSGKLARINQQEEVERQRIKEMGSCKVKDAKKCHQVKTESVVTENSIQLDSVNETVVSSQKEKKKRKHAIVDEDDVDDSNEVEKKKKKKKELATDENSFVDNKDIKKAKKIKKNRNRSEEPEQVETYQVLNDSSVDLHQTQQSSVESEHCDELTEKKIRKHKKKKRSSNTED